jgi:hypothetical protein
MTNKYLLIFIIFIINLLFFHFGLEPNGLSWDNLYKIEGDAIDYVQSAENLLKGKGFTFFKTSEDTEFVSNFVTHNDFNLSIYYAFRSPGFVFFYLPLRVFFRQHFALIGFLFLQIIITAISKYYIAKIAQLISSSTKVFWLILIMVNITPYFVQYNNLLLTESLGFSFLVFGVYLCIKNHTVKHTSMSLALSGLFFTIAFMLRPFLAVFPLAIASYLFIKHFYNLRFALKQIILFITPIILITGIWTVRNYIHTKKIIPLANTLGFQDHKHLAFFEIKKLSLEMGYSDIWFDRNSPVYWYVNQNDIRNAKEIFNKENKHIVSVLDSLKVQFHQSLDQNIALKQRQILEKTNSLALIQFRETVDLTFFEKFSNNLSVLYDFLIQKNVRYFHSIHYPSNVILVFLQSLILKWILIIGIIFSIVYLFITPIKITLMKILQMISLFLVFYFCFMLRLMEARELYTYSFIFLILPIKFALELRNQKFFKLIFFAGLIFVVFLAIQQTILEIKW